MITTEKHYGLDLDGSGMAEAPSAPDNLQEAGLTLGFLNDLILRTLYTRGIMLGRDLARSLCLPFKVIEESLAFLKDEKCLEMNGGDLIGRISYRLTLTALGRHRAQAALSICAYACPAPVRLEHHTDATSRQSPT